MGRAGLVAEENPYDKLQLTATIPSSDPLFQQKRALLQPAGLATQQTFDLQPGKARAFTAAYAVKPPRSRLCLPYVFVRRS